MRKEISENDKWYMRNTKTEMKIRSDKWEVTNGLFIVFTRALHSRVYKVSAWVGPMPCVATDIVLLLITMNIEHWIYLFILAKE